MDEPTAWEDINPQTALARPQGQRLPSLDRLEPASSDVFRNELTACLALVVPVGMTEEGRREWLSVAWATLGHLPPDLLAIGCKKARESCDHPSKIVPAIIAETEQQMHWRRNSAGTAPASQLLPAPKSLMDRRGEAMTEIECAELNSILESLGATARYRPDGSRYQIADAA